MNIFHFNFGLSIFTKGQEYLISASSKNLKTAWEELSQSNILKAVKIYSECSFSPTLQNKTIPFILKQILEIWVNFPSPQML